MATGELIRLLFDKYKVTCFLFIYMCDSSQVALDETGSLVVQNIFENCPEHEKV